MLHKLHHYKKALTLIAEDIQYLYSRGYHDIKVLEEAAEELMLELPLYYKWSVGEEYDGKVETPEIYKVTGWVNVRPENSGLVLSVTPRSGDPTTTEYKSRSVEVVVPLGEKAYG